MGKMSRSVWAFKEVIPPALRKTPWIYQLGLKTQDVMRETEVSKEAVNRLPKKLMDDRTYRRLRAVDVSGQKMILPKDQWMTQEEDDDYLTPYMEQVAKEQQEIKDWYRQV